MRFLHLCDQNWVGMANAFVDAHRRHGHEARLVTLCECVNEYEEDVCLHLPLLKGTPWHAALKRVMNRAHGDRPKFVRAEGGVPEWKPRSAMEAAFFRFREEVLWKGRIERAIREHGLEEFDVYHLESGVGFYRDARFLQAMRRRGARIVSYYLGTDLRDRGAIPGIREISDLEFTCEWDHLALDPSLTYFFLPFDASRLPRADPPGDRLRVCHAPRNRWIKGTELLVGTIERLRAEGIAITLELIEGVTHAEALARKRGTNLLVDQIGDNPATTGYGMNSLEALAMGIPCMTAMTDDYAAFLGEHPFFRTSPGTLESDLRALASDPSLLVARSVPGRTWVERTHGADAVVEGIYARYRELGWMDEAGRPIAAGKSPG